MECPFCQLHLDEKINRTIKEGKLVTTILSNPRLIPGHVLVIPKRHIEKPWEMTDDERKELFDTILFYQKKIIEKFSTGCDIREHYRPFLLQSRVKVDHIHFHLHPRELEDDLFLKSQVGEKELWKDLPEEEVETMFRLLKEDE